MVSIRPIKSAYSYFLGLFLLFALPGCGSTEFIGVGLIQKEDRQNVREGKGRNIRSQSSDQTADVNILDGIDVRSHYYNGGAGPFYTNNNGGLVIEEEEETVDVGDDQTPPTEEQGDLGGDGGETPVDEDEGNIGGDGGEVVTCGNDGPRSFGNGDPSALRRQFVNAAAAKGIALPSTKDNLFGSNNSRGGGNRWNPGDPHIPTVTEVCRVLGYAKFVSMDCYDSERSSKYRKGKCNYHSEGDNALIYFDGTSWKRNSRLSKYGMNWIATIVCDEKICE